MTLTFAGTSFAIAWKTGKNAAWKDLSVSESMLQQASDEAEAWINATARIDLVSSFGSLGANSKKILQDIATNLAAMYLIQQDMSGYTSRSEVQTMLDVLDDRASKGLNLIKDKKVTDFID